MTPNESRPGDGARGAAMVDGLAGLDLDTTAKPRSAKAPRAMIETPHGPEPLALEPRQEWALRLLIGAGARGVSTLEVGAPRLAAYVHKLRCAGVAIETQTEPHGGPFAGHHARYRLRSRVILDGGAE
jgi:hypothetical protein